MSDLLFKCFIPGRTGIKKNSKQIRRVKGRQFMASSNRYLAWEKTAKLTVRGAMIRQGAFDVIDKPIHLKATFHFLNHRSEPDLSNLYEGIQDVLQSCKIIKDDRLIYSHDGSRKKFGEKEGVEIELYRFEEGA